MPVNRFPVRIFLFEIFRKFDCFFFAEFFWKFNCFLEKFDCFLQKFLENLSVFLQNFFENLTVFFAEIFRKFDCFFVAEIVTRQRPRSQPAVVSYTMAPSPTVFTPTTITIPASPQQQQSVLTPVQIGVLQIACRDLCA